MQERIISRTFFVLSLLMVPSSLFGYRYFHRAGPYKSEPRLEKEYMSTFNVSVMGGSATKGRDGNKAKVNALDIYGAHDIAYAFDDYDNSAKYNQPLSAAQGLIVDNMRSDALADADSKIGKFNVASKYRNITVDLNYMQNFKDGFFLDMCLPVIEHNIKDVVLTHQGSNTAAWNTFNTNFDTILAAYNINKKAYKETGVGDFTVMGGWTYNKMDSQKVDFLDITLKAGLSVPTGKVRNQDEIFSLAVGHDGHVGIPVMFDIAIGAYEWLTWGAHVGGQFFLKRTGSFRMPGSANETAGMFTIHRGEARQDLGDIWDAGTFLKADHIFGGFSFMAGYTFSAQEETTRTPTDTTAFPSAVVDADPQLQKWRMHTIHAAAEYDFAQEDESWNPVMSIFYNHPIRGKRIINTNTIGGSLGFNLNWLF